MIKVDCFVAPVIILYGVDKVADKIQHLVKWVIDRYTNTFKIILCCADDADILEAVMTRCKLVTVDAPSTHEVSLTVLIC